jgi:hypothetical protein
VRKALERQMKRDPGKLAVIARLPLFYEMVRQARGHWDKLPVGEKKQTKLETAWFRLMLEEHGHEADPALEKLGQIAGMMLKSRTDLLDINHLRRPLPKLIQHLSHKPFVVFIQDRKDEYAFSHQSLREFVLAQSVAEEIRDGRFALLKSSSSFDYEGAEFYSRVNDLLDFKAELVSRLDSLLKRRGLNETEWNNLARNLFEMVGELVPDNDKFAAVAAKVALKYLNPKFNRNSYVSYKTRYNVARCLERCHHSAPRKPYFAHILSYNWNDGYPDRNHIGAYAVRGFQRKRQEPGPLPPTVFIRKAHRRGNLTVIEGSVSDSLMTAIEKLGDEPGFRQQEDAHFFGINCTHALIRWLPQNPDLDRIERLLKLPYMSTPMKHNVLWALFRRFRSRIPKQLTGKGLFSGSGPEAWPYTESIDMTWAYPPAKRVFEALLSEEPREETVSPANHA